MHQIRFRLGLRPRPRCRGRLQRSPRPLSGILGERKGKGRGGEGNGRRREGAERKVREGKEGESGFSLPKVNFLVTSLTKAAVHCVDAPRRSSCWTFTVQLI